MRLNSPAVTQLYQKPDSKFIQIMINYAIRMFVINNVGTPGVGVLMVHV